MLNVVFILIGMLLGVVFLSLVERKLLGGIQIRKGPNKIFWGGLLQSVIDAIKLFTKEQMMLMKLSKFMYIILPMGMMLICMMMWLVYPMKWDNLIMTLSVLFYICMVSLEGYFLLFMGWISNNKFSIMGSFRGMAQIISYEVVLFTLMLVLMMLMMSLNLKDFIMEQKMSLFIYMVIVMILPIMFIVFVSELNRGPCDLVESESELVSGFNVEFMSYGLSFIFIAEFGGIMFTMLFLTSMILGGVFILAVLMILMILMIRASYPRMRYDLLMSISWKFLLPLSLILFFVLF